MVWGLASESASTLPEASITVARASALPASSFTSCARGTLLSCCTRAANRRVFWVREPVISWRREFSQSRRRVRSRVTVVAAITSRNATSSLANTLLRTAEPHWATLTWELQNDIRRRARCAGSGDFPDHVQSFREAYAHRHPPNAGSRTGFHATPHRESGHG